MNGPKIQQNEGKHSSPDKIGCLQPSYVTMIQNSVQFHGLPSEDPNLHITNILEMCDMFKANGASDDVIRLRLFLFTLKDKAKAWLNSLLVGSIHD